MEPRTKRFEIARYILILAALVAAMSLGWLTGHILRFSNPALWHPLDQEFDPRIKNGFESEGIRRQVVLTGNPGMPQAGASLGGVQLNLFNICMGITYYTSLPAKCHSLDGALVQVGGDPREVFLVPENGP